MDRRSLPLSALGIHQINVDVSALMGESATGRNLPHMAMQRRGVAPDDGAAVGSPGIAGCVGAGVKAVAAAFCTGDACSGANSGKRWIDPLP
jgi:hypothetical protein